MTYHWGPGKGGEGREGKLDKRGLLVFIILIPYGHANLTLNADATLTLNAQRIYSEMFLDYLR